MLHRRCIMSCRSQINITTFQKYSCEGISCQGNPVVRLNGAEVHCHPQQVWIVVWICNIVAFTLWLSSFTDFDISLRWSQVVSIPSLCPHGVNNPGDEAVLIAYTYLPGWVLVLLATNHFHFVPQVQLYQTGAPTQMAVSWRSVTQNDTPGKGWGIYLQ